MDVQICEIYDSSYLNIISALFQDLDLPQLIDRLVPVDPQCQTRTSDAVKLIRPGLKPSWFNDDALARHLDRLYEADIHKVISTCLIHIY
ncbi:DUF4277 domain-containing protein, partial [Geobacillus sp. B4113_201601]|uniref:DUF4277 domain-containing protein n=2 Tax=Geobacillus TaxID=129337 RepID=UPI000B2B6B3A